MEQRKDIETPSSSPQERQATEETRISLHHAVARYVMAAMFSTSAVTLPSCNQKPPRARTENRLPGVVGIDERILNGYTEAFEVINQKRISRGLPPIEYDQAVQDGVEQYVRSGKWRLDDFPDLEDYLPEGSLYLGMQIDRNIGGISPDRLISPTNWSEFMNPVYTHYGHWVFRNERSHKTSILMVLTRQIPRLETPLSRQNHPELFSECGACDEPFVLSIDGRKRKSLLVRCPNCDHCADFLAPDKEGKLRKAQSFLTGELRTPWLDELEGTEKILAICQYVTRRCEYESDQGGDVWQEGLETLQRKKGDCEDTSLLIADLLISEGFEARVVNGTHLHMSESHAWVVVQHNKKEYLIETTEDLITQLYPAESMQGIYFPEAAFDQDHIYSFPSGNQPQRYWSEEWEKIPSSKEPDSEVVLSN